MSSASSTSEIKRFSEEDSVGSPQSSQPPLLLQRMPVLGRSFFLWQKSDSAASGHILEARHSPPSRTHCRHAVSTPNRFSWPDCRWGVCSGREVQSCTRPMTQWHKGSNCFAFPWLKINIVTTQTWISHVEVMELIGLFPALSLLLHLWLYIYF